MNNTKKEILATFLIIAVNVFAFFIAYAANYLLEGYSNIKYATPIFIFYVASVIVITVIDLKIENRIIKIIAAIINFPIALIFALIAILIPVLTSQLYLIIYLIISFFLPGLLYKLDQNYLVTNLTVETWIYIISTSGVIIAILFNKQIEYLTFRIIPYTALKKDKQKRERLVGVCNYIVSGPNIKLVIYILYFLALIFFNLSSFQDSSFFSSQNLDKAILQSFITFLAFDRVMAGLKLSEFKPSELLYILKSSVNREVEDLTGKDKAQLK